MTSQIQNLTQTNDVIQGNPLSPLLFNTAIADAMKALHEQSTKCSLNIYIYTYIYADHMVIAAREKEKLQRALDKLQESAKQNEYNIKET